MKTIREEKRKDEVRELERRQRSISDCLNELDSILSIEDMITLRLIVLEKGEERNED